MLKRCSAFLILIGLLSVAASAQEVKTEKAGPIPKIAHIRLQGAQGELDQFSIPLFNLPVWSFKAQLDRIRKAAADRDVEGLVLQLDAIQLGYAKMEEIRKAIAEFKKSGKKVFAYLEGGSAAEYLVGCEADHIVMPRSGMLMLVGTRIDIAFYKELFDKLGIKADFIHVGIFKFTGEQYFRSHMSKEAKAQYNLLLDDLYANCYVGSIVRSRKAKKNMTPASVMKLIDSGPRSARKALELGLIDELADPGDFRESVRRMLGVKEIEVVRDYGMEKKKGTIDLLKLINPALSKDNAPTSTKDRIAILYAVGPIVTGKPGALAFLERQVNSTTLIEAIREADKDPKVRAIVLRVDSPGGSALASDLIWHELKRCKKPVVASMSDFAASGGYYICMAAKKVYAQPGTITGSIGVVFGKITFGGVARKLGVNIESLARGQNSGVMSRLDTFSPTEKRAVETAMQEFYDQFLDRVAENRACAGKKFTRKQLLEVAEGRIWTGSQAFQRGLVDALGSLDDAIGEAKVMGGLSRDADTDYLILPKPPPIINPMLSQEGDPLLKSLSVRELSLLAELLPELREHARDIAAMLQLRTEPVWMMLPHAIRVR
jgi:protease-4